MKRGFFLLLCLCMLAGCTPKDEPATAQFFAMDTLMSVTIYDQGTQENCASMQQEVNRLERLWSRTYTNSDISNLNAAAGQAAISLSPETYDLLTYSMQLQVLTGGALDVTIAPVMDVWGFGTADSFEDAAYRVPSQEDLDAILPLVHAQSLILTKDGDSIPSGSLPESGMAVDLGAVAKGRLSDLLREQLLSEGISSALLDLGGNVTVLGQKPDGSSWRVGIKDPQDTSNYFCVVSLSDKTCSTSGGYERYFDENGIRYHHILDPETGYPAQSGLISVTAVSQNGTLADALSTACYIMGPEKAEALWISQGQQLGFDLVLTRTDGLVLITEGLEAGLDFQGEDAGYRCEILHR